MRHSSPERLIPQSTHRLAVFSWPLFASLSAWIPRRPQFKTQTYDQKKREANDISVAIINLGAFMHLRSLF